MTNLVSENRNYKDLIDKAEGAYLKKDYLEAFLIQSCVIEGVIKKYSETKLLIEFSQSETLRSKSKNFELARLIDDLLLAQKIQPVTYDNLNKYRKKRNDVIHHLLEHDNDQVLNAELKETYEIGKVMNGSIVDDMATETQPGVTIEELEAEVVSLIGQIKEIDPKFMEMFRDI